MLKMQNIENNIITPSLVLDKDVRNSDATTTSTTETMGMGIGINTKQADEGSIDGKQMPVACGVWFTSTGRVIPHTIKYEDWEGMIQTLTNFSIILEENKFYCGIPATKYLCEFIDEQQLIEFWLLYYLEEKKWKMWFK